MKISASTNTIDVWHHGTDSGVTLNVRTYLSVGCPKVGLSNEIEQQAHTNITSTRKDRENEDGRGLK